MGLQAFGGHEQQGLALLVDGYLFVHGLGTQNQQNYLGQQM